MNTPNIIVKCRSCGYVGPCDPTCCEHPDYDGASAEEAWQAALESQEVRALKKDAKRYRAWREATCNEDESFVDTVVEHINSSLGEGQETPTFAQIDAGIDAAMEKQK